MVVQRALAGLRPAFCGGREQWSHDMLGRALTGAMANSLCTDRITQRGSAPVASYPVFGDPREIVI
jgi:hypothetical protein